MGIGLGFLRWHYPDQVMWVGGGLSALSARQSELPGLSEIVVADVASDGEPNYSKSWVAVS